MAFHDPFRQLLRRAVILMAAEAVAEYHRGVHMPEIGAVELAPE